jgi:hypothetical protein
MKKKIIMTLLASTLIVGSMTGCGSTKLTKSSITIELGNEDAIKISDFMDLSKDELKSAKLNTKDVNFFKEGNYKATISYKDKDYDIKVKVKDTVAPKITVSDNITVQTNTPLHISDIITNVTELSGNIDASFKDKPKSESTDNTESVSATENTENTESTESGSASVIAVGGCNLKHNDEITYTKSGDYDNTITVTDDAGNTSDIDIKISVIDAPSINGISDKTVTVGDTVDYLSGVTATDGKGTDITGNIEVDSSKVDINTPGTYQITYKVTDSYGFSTGANCNITVNEKKEEVADNTSDGNDNTTTSDNGNKKSSKKNKRSNNTASNNNSSSNNSGSNTSNGSTSTANSEPNDGKKTFTSSFGETIRTNPNNYKYDTKYAAEFYPKGFWANGECLTMNELSDATQGKNEAAARYMLAGGASDMTQDWFDYKYMSEEDFIAKYGYSNKW